MSVPLPPAFQRVDLDRWRAGSSGRAPLSEAELRSVAGGGAGPPAEELREVYEAVAALVAHRRASVAALHRSTDGFVASTDEPPPFVLGIAGSVAVGKSTTARALQVLIERWPGRPTVRVVSTDAFLLPNEEIDSRGLTMQKGYPQSYDRPALLRFLAEIKAGRPAVRAPVYSHVLYDVVPDEVEVVDRPDVLILEGLNVLEVSPPAAGTPDASIVSDHLDMSIYVDAEVADIAAWFVSRFAVLRRQDHPEPDAFYRQFADLTEAEADAVARWTWSEINLPNLLNHIAPTRTRADLILYKGPDHRVSEVQLRRA